MTPEAFVALLVEAEQSDAKQRGLREIKALPSLRLSKESQALLLLGGGAMTPIVEGKGQLDPTRDHLMRFVDSFPQERGAQDRILIDHLLPGLLEGFNI